MPDVNAAIGLARLEKAEEFRCERQRCAECYYKNLDGINVIDFPLCTGPMENHSWHLFPVIIKPESTVTRNEFIIKMKEVGIGTSVHYIPLHRMSYYKGTYKLDPGDFPNTEKIWNGTVSLPIYPGLTESELDYICHTIRKILKYQ